MQYTIEGKEDDRPIPTCHDDDPTGEFQDMIDVAHKYTMAHLRARLQMSPPDKLVDARITHAACFDYLGPELTACFFEAMKIPLRERQCTEEQKANGRRMWAGMWPGHPRARIPAHFRIAWMLSTETDYTAWEKNQLWWQQLDRHQEHYEHAVIGELNCAKVGNRKPQDFRLPLPRGQSYIAFSPGWGAGLWTPPAPRPHVMN